MPTTTTSPSTQSSSDTVGVMADRASRKAEQALDSTQQFANDAIDSLKNGVAQMRDAVPARLDRAAAQVKDLTNRGIDRARDLSNDVKDKAQRAGDRTMGYIQDEPVKAILIAAAAGAAVALIVGALTRSSNRD